MIELHALFVSQRDGKQYDMAAVAERLDLVIAGPPAQKLSLSYAVQKWWPKQRKLDPSERSELFKMLFRNIADLR